MALYGALEQSLNALTNKEPAVSIGSTITAVLIAIVAVLRSAGVAVTDEMTDGITTLVYALCAVPAIAGFLTRFAVYSPNSVEKIADTQYQAGVPPTTSQPKVPPPAKS